MRRMVRRIVLFVLLVFVLYLLISTILYSSYRINSVSMQPTLGPGDLVLVSRFEYGISLPFGGKRWEGSTKIQRGDIVLVRPPYVVEEGFWNRLYNHIRSLRPGGNQGKRLMVKRVIALPGDSLRAENFSYFIKPPDRRQYIKELELIKTDYQRKSSDPLETPQNLIIPFNGTLSTRHLRENEFFLTGDNRLFSSDSRSWGPVSRDRILGRVVLRYWPFSDFELFRR